MEPKGSARWRLGRAGRVLMRLLRAPPAAPSRRL